MAEFLETTSYAGDVSSWRDTPETDDDPDDDPDALDLRFDLYANDKTHSGLMVAVSVPGVVATDLMVADGVDPHELHITLCYVKDWSACDLADIAAGLRDAVGKIAPFPVQVAGTGRFPASESSDGYDVVYAAVSQSPPLLALRQAVFEALTKCEAFPSTNFEWTPHITLSYVDPSDDFVVPTPNVRFPVDEIALRVGHSTSFFLLGWRTRAEQRALQTVARLPRVDGKLVRSADVFGRPVAGVVGALNRKTTVNMVGPVRLSDLEPNVEFISVDGLSRYITAWRRDPADVMVLAMRDGRVRYIVHDGHTRIAAARLRGDDTIEARLWHFTENDRAEYVPTVRGYQRRTLLLDQREAAIKAWETRGRSDLSPSERAVQKHIVDFKAERGLTGPGFAKIDEAVTGATFSEYMRVPGLDAMHEAMGVEPSLDTDPYEYQKSRDALFKDQPVKDVPLSRLTFTQPRINVGRAEELSRVTDQLEKPVQVIKVGDQHYLMNGHHRVVGSYIAGRTKVRARVFEPAPRRDLTYRERLVFALERDQREAALKAWDTRGRSDDIGRSEMAKRTVATSYKTTDPAKWLPGQEETHLAYEGDPVRKLLHDAIVDDSIGNRPVHDEPIAYYLGGGPGSGKTTLLNSGVLDVPSKDSYVLSNPDDVKEKLPEYHMAKDAKNLFAATIVHEESSALAKRVAYTGLSSGHHVLVDNVGDSGLTELSSRLDKLRANGAKKIVANYVTVDTDEAMRRVTERQKKTGRGVPETVVRSSHADVSRTFQAAIKAGVFDEANLYDTSARSPVHVASYKNGKLVIHNAAAWKGFVKKGYE